MKVVATGLRLAKWAAYAGLACGVLYSVGGFFYDLFTVGLNGGTALAFMALVGMPAIFGALGFLGGLLLAVITNGVRTLLGWLRTAT